MRTTRARLITAAVVAAAASTILAGCSDKANEPFKDAPRHGTNSAPAEVIEMPDGFSNIAGKCDGPNFVYTAFHGDHTYASVAVVPNDPRCTP